MTYKKFFKLQRTFREETETKYVDSGGIEISEGNEEILLNFLKEKVKFPDRQFNNVAIWNENATAERKSVYGGIETWRVNLIFALEIEGRLFELTELQQVN